MKFLSMWLLILFLSIQPVYSKDVTGFANIKHIDQLFTVINKIRQYGNYKISFENDFDRKFANKSDFTTMSFHNINTYQQYDLRSSLGFTEQEAEIEKFSDNFFGGSRGDAAGNLTITANKYVEIGGIDFKLEIEFKIAPISFAYYFKNNYNEMLFF